MPDLYIVYISEFDFLNEGKTTYHIDKVIRETGTVVDDGLREIFVNTAINDGTDIAELMSCFKMKKVESKRFPVLSGEATRLKETEGGLTSMCQVMQHYEAIAEAKGEKRGDESARIEILKNMLKSGMSFDAAVKLVNIPSDKWAEYRQKISAC